MIFKKIFYLVIIALQFTFAKEIVDCRVMIRGVLECNPYPTRLQYVVSEKDNKGKIQFFSTKKPSLLDKKPALKIISSQEILFSHLKHSKSLYIEKKPKLKVTPLLESEEIVLLATADETMTYGKYVITSEDSLNDIARKFEISLIALFKINMLNNNSTLRVGETLNIPLKQSRVDRLASATYTIKKGDTLGSIAQQFNFTANDLLQFNYIIDERSIKIGKVLHLPLPYILEKIKAEEKKAFSEGRKPKLRIHSFGTNKLRVTATAYTSHRNQTDSTPFLAAWNNHIRPGMRMIAVSRDLLRLRGIKNGTKVRISGLTGFYRIKDKMNKRYRKRIDIYMGLNKKKALKWGKRSVVIYW